MNTASCLIVHVHRGLQPAKLPFMRTQLGAMVRGRVNLGGWSPKWTFSLEMLLGLAQLDRSGCLINSCEYTGTPYNPSPYNDAVDMDFSH